MSEANRLRSDLPIEVQETLSKHEAAGTTDHPDYRAAEKVFNDRHVCRVVPNPPEVDATFAGIEEDRVEPDARDVFSKIRKDFDVAGVAQSDEQILQVIYEFTLQAADPNQAKSGGGDAAAVMLARNLSRRP